MTVKENSGSQGAVENSELRSPPKKRITLRMGEADTISLAGISKLLQVRQVMAVCLHFCPF